MSLPPLRHWTMTPMLWVLPHDHVPVVARHVVVVVDQDAKSVNTRDWACIRLHESTNGKLSSNLYQFQNAGLMRSIGMTAPAGSYTRAEQNSFALKAYAIDVKMFHDGFHAWRADWLKCGIR